MSTNDGGTCATLLPEDGPAKHRRKPNVESWPTTGPALKASRYSRHWAGSSVNPRWPLPCSTSECDQPKQYGRNDFRDCWLTSMLRSSIGEIKRQPNCWRWASLQRPNCTNCRRLSYHWKLFNEPRRSLNFIRARHACEFARFRVLEQVDTAEARSALEELAGGDAQAWRTQPGSPGRPGSSDEGHGHEMNGRGDDVIRAIHEVFEIFDASTVHRTRGSF